MPVADAGEDLRGELAHARLDIGGHARWILEAAEGIGAGKQVLVDDPEHLDVSFVHVAVHVHLVPGEDLLGDHVVRVDAEIGVPGQQVVERLHQPLDHELLERPERQVAPEFLEVVDAPGKHREGRFHRFDEAGQLKGELVPAAHRIRERSETRRGLGGYRGERLAGVELVLRGQNHAGVVARKPQFLSYHRGDQGAEVLIVAEDPVQALAAKALHHLVDEAEHVETRQAQVLRKTEDVEARISELIAIGVLGPGELQAVPVFGEEYEDAFHGLVLRRVTVVGCRIFLT